MNFLPRRDFKEKERREDEDEKENTVLDRAFDVAVRIQNRSDIGVYDILSACGWGRNRTADTWIFRLKLEINKWNLASNRKQFEHQKYADVCRDLHARRG